MEAVLPVIVVPDGLSMAVPARRVLPEPSFVYRAALDYVLGAHRDAPVLLAPANHFGGDTSEQQAAAAYLRSRGASRIVCPVSPPGGYIDTRGNARELRRFLEERGEWPLAPAILVAAKRHARRARLCFLKEGYRLHATVPVPYRIPAEEGLVRRLWYYRYPTAHSVYELLAYLRDVVRPGTPPMPAPRR